MNEEEIKILIKDNKIITLKELFLNEQKTRKEMAKFSFEEKIRILIDLQKLAYSWGNRKDTIVWKI